MKVNRYQILIILLSLAGMLAELPLHAQRIPRLRKEESKPAVPEGRQAMPIERLLNPDGSLNTNSGYSGPVDIEGWRVVTDETGRPRFVRGAEAGVTGAASPADGDEEWSNTTGRSAINGEILAVAASGRNVYIGGTFSSIDELPVSRIAHWDGTSWRALGSGVNGFVYTLTIRNGQLYAGGEFTSAGGVSAANIARWDPAAQSWSALGAGITGGKPTFVATITTDNTHLYVGGYFERAGGVEARNIARMALSDGSWSALGTGAGNGINGEVLGLAVRSGVVYAGGSFSAAGGVSARNIAMWTSSTGAWAAMGAGINGYVNEVIASEDKVYAGGKFDTAGTMYSRNIARWMNGQWRALHNVEVPTSNGVNNEVRALAIGPGNLLGDKVQGLLYIGGLFRSFEPPDMQRISQPAGYIVRWYERNGSTAEGNNIYFASLGYGALNGVNGFVNSIAAGSDGIYATGQFGIAGGKAASRIARWDGERWWALGTSVDAPILSLAALGSDIYGVGKFTATGSETPIARWDGRRWNGITGVVTGELYAVAVSGDYLYIGGQFSSAGGVSAVNIARWNSKTNTWSALGEGSGVGGGTSPYVSTIAINGNDVYIGGSFTIAGDVRAANIAKWNSTSGEWTALGTGINGYVNAIAISGTDVFVGGGFNLAGGLPAANVARWDGSSWSALGNGVDNMVHEITINGNHVYFGGIFTRAGDSASGYIARWDRSSSTWSSMGGGIGSVPFPIVESIVVLDGSVFVGGLFNRAGGVDAVNVARWDGAQWHPLGSGTDNKVRAMVVSGGSIYLGGDFIVGGGKPAYYFAKWR